MASEGDKTGPGHKSLTGAVLKNRSAHLTDRGDSALELFAGEGTPPKAAGAGGTGLSSRPMWSSTTTTADSVSSDSEQTESTSACTERPRSPEHPLLAVPARPRKKAGREARGLLFHGDVHPVLQFNKYIRSGYRAGDTYGEAVGSMFRYHNETGNIWSHFAPALYLLALAVAGSRAPWPGYNWIYWLDILSRLLCMLASTSYHTCMMCHYHYARWLKVDVCSIMAMSLTSWSASIVWGLPCQPRLSAAFLALYVAIGCLALTRIVCAGSAKERALALGMLWAVRVAVLVTRGVLGGPAVATHAVTYFIGEQVMGFVGGAINAAKVPERWVLPKGGREPGVFDYWLNSHQIMHVMAVVGMVFGHIGVRLDAASYAAGVVCPGS